MKTTPQLKYTFALLCGAILTTNITFAAPAPGGAKRGHVQPHRLQQGASSGQVTPPAARRPGREERALRHEVGALKADGAVTPAGRRELHHKNHAQATHPPHPLPPPDPGVNQRQHLQRDRIAQGVRSGQLTREEAAQLAREQQAIRAEERAYKADGKLTVTERKDLQQDISAASKNIHDAKHDADVRAKSAPAVTPPATAPNN